MSEFEGVSGGGAAAGGAASGGVAAQVLGALDAANAGGAPDLGDLGGPAGSARDAGGESGRESGNAAPDGKNPGLDPQTSEADKAGDAGGGRGAQSQESGEQEAEAGKTAPDPLDMPLKDASKIDLGLAEDVRIDDFLVDAFKNKAVEIGLTGRQAANLASWMAKQEELARERATRRGAQELADEWGERATANQQAVMELVTNIDKALGGGERFSHAIKISGIGCQAGFMAGMAKIAATLAEDSLGASGRAAADTREETPLEGIEAAFKAARSRRG